MAGGPSDDVLRIAARVPCLYHGHDAVPVITVAGRYRAAGSADAGVVLP